MWNAGLDELQAGIKIAGRNINNLRYVDDTTLMAESKEELNNLLMRVMVENEKAGWKLNIKKTKTMASGSITSWQIEEEKVEAVTDFLFLGSKITADGDCNHNQMVFLLGRKAMTNLDSMLKSKDITLPTKGQYSQGHGLSSNQVLMWELDHNKEGGALKNWCFWTVVLEKTPESSLDRNEIEPVNLKGNQPWILFGRTNVEAESPTLWPPDVKSWLIGKDPDVWKYWRQEEKGMAEDEMVGWHHWLYGLEFEQALGVGDGQGSLACCNQWGPKESNRTEWLSLTWDPTLLIYEKCPLYLGVLAYWVQHFHSIIFEDLE